MCCRGLGLYRCDVGGDKETGSKSVESRKWYLSHENFRKFWVYKGVHDVRKEDFCCFVTVDIMVTLWSGK